MKAVVFTLGCKVNECESDSLISSLIDLGYEVSDKLVFADIYIVNTCAVTKEAEKKSRQAVSRILKLNPDAKIIMTGCATQKNPDAFISKKGVQVVTGVFEKGKILHLIDKSGVLIAPESTVFEELKTVKGLRTRAFIKVQDGCNNFCSYCIIPYLRGRCRSRSIDSVKSEIAKLDCAEIVLNGINLSAYDSDGKTLTDLICALEDVDARIRLGSLEVGVIDQGFLTALKGLKNFAPHFHLSLQSGSDKVLKDMNRKYTRSEYAKKVDLIREYFPNAGITTDIIVGYPTETDEDFSNTVELIERVKFSDIHPFIFSAREGTVAYKLKPLSDEIKKARLDKLLELKASCKRNFILEQTGKIASVLIEEKKDGYYQGYTENYVRAYIKDDLTSGEIVKVKITGAVFDGALVEKI